MKPPLRPEPAPGMDVFLSALVGRGFWYHERSSANRHGDTVRLYVDSYRPASGKAAAEVMATAVYQDGSQGRAYINANYLYDRLKGTEIQFL